MLLETLGNTYGESDKEERCYRRALETYRELGNAYGQGTCLIWLAGRRLTAGKAPEARPYYEQALPLFEAAGSLAWVAVSRAHLDLLDEVGSERLASLLQYDAVCYHLRAAESRVILHGQPGFGVHVPFEQMPADLAISAALYQVAHVNRTILDTSVPVGGSRSDDAFSYSCRPLCATVTVKSDTEHVTVPAGSFEGCLLTELVTVESNEPDEAPERSRDLNRRFRCGTRRAWWAPGVGLVQLQVQTAAGAEALIQLQEYRVQDGGDEWLPLAVGNEWRYTQANAPTPYHKTELYRVMASSGDSWYLESYGYLEKR